MSLEGRPLQLAVWFHAARPRTLWASVSPVVVGTALAFSVGRGHWPSAATALVAALLIQIGTNLANDLHDFERGADTAERIGPARVTQSGLVSARRMRAAVGIVFGLAILAGVPLVLRGGIPILCIGILSILSGLAYTAGPRPLGYIGLGDPFVFFFFGLVPVAGTYYVQALGLTPGAVWAGVPMGCLATAILDVNNLRDIETDRLAGKRTLAVRMGRAGTRAQYAVLLGVSACVPAAGAALGALPVGTLLASASIAAGWPDLRRVLASEDGPTLNRALAGTARLQGLYAAAFAAGLFL
jgi:1,4-dihydroxy-2-naphthoate octaprenyltransferase